MFEAKKDKYLLKLRLGFFSNLLKISCYVALVSGAFEFGILGFKFKNFKSKKKKSKEIKKEKKTKKKSKKKQFFDENWDFERKIQFSRVIITEILKIFQIEQLNANIIAGFENPAHTGIFIGNYYSIINQYPILKNLIISPDFTKKQFDGIGRFQFSFRIIMFLKIGYLILTKDKFLKKQ